MVIEIGTRVLTHDVISVRYNDQYGVTISVVNPITNRIGVCFEDFSLGTKSIKLTNLVVVL